MSRKIQITKQHEMITYGKIVRQATLGFQISLCLLIASMLTSCSPSQRFSVNSKTLSFIIEDYKIDFIKYKNEYINDDEDELEALYIYISSDGKGYMIEIMDDVLQNQYVDILSRNYSTDTIIFGKYKEIPIEIRCKYDAVDCVLEIITPDSNMVKNASELVYAITTKGDTIASWMNGQYPAIHEKTLISTYDLNLKTKQLEGYPSNMMRFKYKNKSKSWEPRDFLINLPNGKQ